MFEMKNDLFAQFLVLRSWQTEGVLCCLRELGCGAGIGQQNKWWEVKGFRLKVK